MTYPAALALDAHYGLQREFAMSYRQVRPWWAFWISEERAVWSALVDCDLQGHRVTSKNDDSLTEQIRAKVRQRKTDDFLRENAAAVAEAERIAKIQRSRDREDLSIKVGVSLATVVIALSAVWLFFGPDAPAPPKTDAEIRHDELSIGFSVWNGSHIELTQRIKAAMNDPDSYEHVDTRYRDNGDHLIVTTSFRGANAFGGKVVNTWTARTAIDGRVLQIISTQ